MPEKNEVMTPEQALNNLADVANRFTGYSMQGVDIIRDSIRVLAAAIEPTEDPKPAKKEPAK